MKNREKYIINSNEYDLLVKMQKHLREHGAARVPCVLDMIIGQIYPCQCDDCSHCIEQWLNEESR